MRGDLGSRPDAATHWVVTLNKFYYLSVLPTHKGVKEPKSHFGGILKNNLNVYNLLISV